MSFSDTESERMVIAAIMGSDVACIEAFTQLDMDDFEDPLCREMFGIAHSIYARGISLSYPVFLKEAAMLDVVDLAKVHRMKEIVTLDPGDERAEYWVERVKKTSKARKAEKSLRLAVARLKSSDVAETDEVINDLVEALARIESQNDGGIDAPDDIAAALEKDIAESIRRFEAAQAGEGPVLEGVSTGLKKLDSITLGYKAGDLIILAAQTGHGKTAFALHTARCVAIQQNVPTLYVNTEMGRKQINQRLCAGLSGVPVFDIRQGNLRGSSAEKVNKAIKAIKNSGFFHAYEPHLTPSRCVMLARKARIQHGIRFLIIDYIGRMEKYDPKQQEWQVLEQIAKSMKLLAQELDMPVLVLAQLNEDGSLQGAKRIKNECDLLLKLLPLSEEEKKGKFADYPAANYRVYVDKNRDGEGAKNIPIRFELDTQRLQEVESKDAEWESLGEVVRGGIK
ncbi:MAG TPA: DnaB-like helicase C-terminal domain-containing protein [Armatimonadota bacterium]|nr:DnaB-like helicase C-terminal domain-containing protein [Armatimonadota bacterium]